MGVIRATSYIGYPGSQLNRMSQGPSMLFKDHMEEKFVIAEIKPCVADVSLGDGNAYQPKTAIGDFKIDLDNAGHQMEGEVLKIVISNPQSVTETYSNQFGDSEIFGGAGRALMGGAAQEIAFLGNITDTDKLDEIAQDFSKDNPIMGGIAKTLTGTYKSATDWVKQKGAQMTSAGNESLGNMMNQLAEIAKAPWSKVNWPQMWKNCSYQQSYELNTRLYCYYNSQKQDYEDNILAPLAALQLLVTPKSKDGFLYTWPYIFDFKIDGVLHMGMAYCSSLTVVKGGDEADFAADGRPNIIDVRMSIQNCYSVMVNSKVLRSKGMASIKTDSEGMQKGKDQTGTAGTLGNGEGKSNPSTGSTPSGSSSSSSSSTSPNSGRRGSTSQVTASRAGLGE